jgi:hypothetical protein
LARHDRLFRPMRHRRSLKPSIANKAPVTAREATELLKLRRALQAKADRREPECVPEPLRRRDNVFRE